MQRYLKIAGRILISVVLFFLPGSSLLFLLWMYDKKLFYKVILRLKRIYERGKRTINIKG